MTTDTIPNQPSHYVYAVQKGSKGGKGFWTRIGAAWANRDGEGFNLKLDYLPLNGAELVVRKPKPQPEATEPAQAD